MGLALGIHGFGLSVCDDVLQNLFRLLVCDSHSVTFLCNRTMLRASARHRVCLHNHDNGGACLIGFIRFWFNDACLRACALTPCVSHDDSSFAKCVRCCFAACIPRPGHSPCRHKRSIMKLHPFGANLNEVPLQELASLVCSP